MLSIVIGELPDPNIFFLTEMRLFLKTVGGNDDVIEESKRHYKQMIIIYNYFFTGI